MSFVKRVKHIVKKLHGLNTRQYCNFEPQIQQNQFQGSLQYAVIREVSVDSPGQITNVIPALTDNTEKQIYIKRLYRTLTYTNNSLFPVICQATWVRCRFDMTTGITALLQVDAPNAYFPYLSSYTGDDFRKKCKIVKQKTITMKSGIPYTFKVKSNYQSRKPITGDVEGDLLAFNYRKGNTVLLLKWYGIPQQNYIGGGFDGTVLSSVIINGVSHTYASYYTMDDAEPTSTASMLIPPNIAETNLGWNPTMYAGAAQNAELIMPQTIAVYTLPD